MIEVKNLSVQTSKGVVLLDHVEFTLTPGVCTGLTGASGSGKTTLLKALRGVSAVSYTHLTLPTNSRV